MLVIFVVTLAQMVVVGAVVWLVYKTKAWWAYVMIYLLVVILSIGWVSVLGRASTSGLAP